MRVLWIALAGIAVPVVVALVVAPRLIDWNRFKPEIVALVERATGRTLAIDGDLGFALLPVPTLSAAGVRLGGAPGAPDLVRLKSLDARIAFGPLLGGRIVADSLALVEPSLVIAADGAAGGWPSGLEDRLGFGRVIVVDGSIEWQRPGGVVRIDRINAEITGASPAGAAFAGPVKLSGDAAWRGQFWRFDLGIGQLGAPAPVNLSIGLRGGAANLRLTGTLDPDAERWLTGRLRADANRLPAVLAAFGVAGALPAPLGQPASAEAALQVSRDRIALNDLALTLGDDQRASGALGLALASGSFDQTLAVNRIDAERWASLLPAPPPAAAPAPVLRGTIDLSVDAVLWRGGVIRQARLGGVLGSAGLTVKQAGAQLPGGSDIALFGQLSLGDAPRFDGQLEGGADNLRSVFAWLKLDTDAIPADRLRRVSLTTGLSITPVAVELANLDLRFDASRLTGSVVATAGARPALGINLRLDRLNLEAYLPRRAAAPPSGPAPYDWLTRFDANLRLHVDQLTYDTLPLQGLEIDASLERGVLRLDELSTENAAGLHATIGGIVRRAAWPAELELTATAQADDPSRVLQLLGYDLATPALGPLSASVSATGALDHVRLAVDLGLAGGTLHASAEAADLLAPRGALALSLHHDETVRLLRALLPAYRPAAEALGALALTGTLSLDTDHLALTDAALTLGATRLELRAGADLANPRLSLTARLAGAGLALDPLLPRRLAERPAVPLGADLWTVLAGVPSTLAALGAIDASATIELGTLDYAAQHAVGVALDLAVHERSLTAARFSAEGWGGHVTLSGAFDPLREPALSLRATLAGVAAEPAVRALLGAAPLDGRLDLEASVTASGTTERALLGSLAGEGRLSLHDGGLAGLDLAALASRLRPGAVGNDQARGVEQDLSHGRTALATLAGAFSVRGARLATDDMTASGPGGDIALAGGLDAATRRLDVGLTVQPAGAPAPPPARLQFSGSLDAPTRTIDDQALLAFLAARAAAPAAGTRPGSGGR